MFGFLNDSIWGSIFGLLGFIVGVLGLILFIKSRVRAKPTCYMEFLRLIGEEPQALPKEIKIVFNDAPVPRVSLVTAYFWNDGRETLYGRQIVEDDPLRFEFAVPSEVLKAHVVSCTREVNKFRVETASGFEPPNLVKIYFDYLDPGDGARIEIHHTSKEQYPKLQGSLRAIPKGVRVFYFGVRTLTNKMLAYMYRSKLFEPMILYIGLAMSLFLVSMALMPSGIFHTVHSFFNRMPTTKGSMLLARGLYLFIGILVMIPFISILSRKRKIYPTALDVERGQTFSGIGNEIQTKNSKE